MPVHVLCTSSQSSDRRYSTDELPVSSHAYNGNSRILLDVYNCVFLTHYYTTATNTIVIIIFSPTRTKLQIFDIIIHYFYLFIYLFIIIVVIIIIRTGNSK